MTKLLWSFPWLELFFIVFCMITLVQLFYYGWFFRRLAFYSPPAKDSSQQHPVSVIICARDEAARLVTHLPGALVQKYPSTHEVIVVNHNSQDDTRFLLDEFKKTFKGLHIVNLEYDAIGIPGKKYPLSMGIKEALYEIVLLTDADCVPATEFWIQKMQDAYRPGVDVVLGYSPYKKGSGMLNKLIRFDTFHTALQYFSYALAGVPYMGVGRNLSYKREIFFRNKGFSALNHVPGGDDDLFINKVATKTNTAIVIDPDTYTVSEPKKTFGEWFRQKSRHYTTAKYYKPRHKFLLGVYSASLFLFYPLFIAGLFFSWKITLAIFAVRFLFQALIFNRSMRALGEEDLFPLWWLLDIWMFFYFLIFASTLWKKPRKDWK
jgi:glycosyltransferase involved in cell wall biosynthesis